MLSMQSNEVKSRFAEILRKVEEGQEIGITRHGKLIARLCPWASEAEQSVSRSEAVEKMKRFRKRSLGKGESISEMREEGRR